MEIIKSYIDRSKLDENKNITKNMCFFDIETTGFNRSSDIIYLVGVLYFDFKADSWVLAQYFANELKDEPKLLMESAQFLMKFDTIINYNGNSFDIPFINHKLSAYKIPIQVDKERSLDLYSLIRKNKSLLNIENLKLKTIERYLGIYRDDIYSGKDCIDFYKDYILTGEKELKERLLKHNYDDLYYLVDVIDILDIIRSKKSFIVNKANKPIEFLLSNIKQSKTSLIFQGDVEGLKEKYIHYDTGFDLLIEDTSRFNLTVHTQKGLISPEETCLFIDKDDFNISNNIKSSHKYNIPRHIFLLKIESTYLHDDILNFLQELIQTII